MSLVGTRPPTIDEWEKYELRHRARLSIKPGLTGMWQVSGRSNITDFEEVVELDTKALNCELKIAIELRKIYRRVCSALLRQMEVYLEKIAVLTYPVKYRKHTIS